MRNARGETSRSLSVGVLSPSAATELLHRLAGNFVPFSPACAGRATEKE
jgi:hypothetical protein